jgi:hypothetical protein
MLHCKIETKCPFATNCNIKDIAEFCAFHRDNDTSLMLPPERFDPMDSQIDDTIYPFDELNSK